MPEVVEIAWREWGHTLPDDERPRWLREATQDSRLHLPTSAGFVAVDEGRAVGTVMNRNPLPIVLPCHRVIGANGKLVGYGGGLERKETLLRLEGALL